SPSPDPRNPSAICAAREDRESSMPATRSERSRTTRNANSAARIIARSETCRMTSRARMGSFTGEAPGRHAPTVSLVLQAVTHAAHGPDERPSERALELSAEVPDVHVHHVREPHVV